MIYQHFPYENKFNLDDKLCLKNYDYIKNINSKFRKNYNWILKERDFNVYFGKSLFVHNVYFFHNGLPIYELTLDQINISSQIKLYEGYLRTCSKELNLYNIRLLSEFSNDYSRMVDDLKKNNKNLRHSLNRIKKDIVLIKKNKTLTFVYFKLKEITRLFEQLRNLNMNNKDFKLFKKLSYEKREILNQLDELNCDEQNQMVRIELAVFKLNKKRRVENEYN